MSRAAPGPTASAPSSATRAHLSDCEHWLAVHRTPVVLVIFALALGLRGLCLAQLAGGPVLQLHRWPESDMNYFHVWAETIVGGDPLSRSIRPPLHALHRHVAAGYAAAFPDRWAALVADASGGDPDAAARRLWERWCVPGRYYQDPLYPYLIALTYALLGANPLWVVGGQALAGALSVVLVYFITRRHFGHVAAVLAAGIGLLCGPLLFYDFVLLRTAFVSLCGLLLAWLLDEARDRARPATWLLAGLASGAAVLLQSQFLIVLGAGALLAIGVARRPTRPSRGSPAPQPPDRGAGASPHAGPPSTRGAAAPGAVRLLAYLCGAAVALSPLAARNIAVGAPALSLPTGGTPSFVLSNAAGATARSVDADRTGRILGEVGNRFGPAARAALCSHPSPASYGRLLADKLLATLHWHEIPENVNFYYGRLHAPVLRGLPLSAGVVLPLAFVGAALAGRRLRDCAGLCTVVTAHLLALLAFFVDGRFRAPLCAACLPFAGLSLLRLVEWFEARRWKALGWAALALAALLALTHRPRADAAAPLVRVTDVAVGYEYFYGPRVEAALAEEDPGAAADALAPLLRELPAPLPLLGPSRPARDPAESALAAYYADLYQRHARLLRSAGRLVEADLQQSRTETLRRALPR